VPSTATADEKRLDLVFEGGGVKGIGLAGAFDHLDKQGFTPQRVAGTSAGAITAAMVAAGYHGDELRKLVLEEMDFESFEDGGNRLAQGVELLRHKGLNPGTYFETWMRRKLEKKGVTKFGDLKHPVADGDDGLAYRLQLIASDVSGHRMLVLPRDAHDCLGIEPDELEIAHAVRMSMSIPIFFDPVIYTNPENRDDHLTIVDGGILSNFPVWLFDRPAGQVPRWPTFGLLLVAPDQVDPLGSHPSPQRHPRLSMLQFLKAIASTMMEAHDRVYVEHANYARTIPIDTLGVRTTEFNLSPKRKQELFDSGRRAAADFLKSWNFDDYIKAFRSADRPTRRQRVVDEMDRVRGG
jgi:NTE family protein